MSKQAHKIAGKAEKMAGEVAGKMVVIDYRQTNAANSLLPQPSILSSSGWSKIHLELYQQPRFEIAEHQHTMHVIAYGLADLQGICSAGERWLDGKLERERRSTGDIAIIPAGVAHRCNWNTTAQFMILAVEPALLQEIGQDWVNPDAIELIPRFMSHQDGFVQGILSTLRTEAESGAMGSHLLVDSLKTALAIHLLRNYCSTQPRIFSNADGLSVSQLQQVKDYINDHLHQDLKLNELAAIVQISPYHFLRLFKQRMGITPHQYILQCRIERAKSLLQHSHLSIAEIAIRVGFCDQSHFTRYFKRVVGVTPTQFLLTHP
jgi:AraC family transcriptional regulator